MHFEVLVEDESGMKLLEMVLPKILSDHDTWRIKSYKGIGAIPRKLKPKTDPAKRVLLDQLPRIIAGYGKTFPEGNHNTSLVIVVDVDRRPCREFLADLNRILKRCDPKPRTLFRLAIEECEAWLLGDPKAVKRAYPGAKSTVIRKYEPDSICDTWEKLADAIYPGGSAALLQKAYPEIGKVKCEWATNIGAFLDVETNESASFGKFRDGLRRFADNKRS